MNPTDSKDRPVWARLGFMLLFGLVLQVVELILALVAIVQLISWIVRGESYGELRSLGGRLANYVREIVSFLTFHTDDLPYPFLNEARQPEGSTTPAGS